MFKYTFLSVLLVVGAVGGTELGRHERGAAAGLEAGLEQRGLPDVEPAHQAVKRQSSSQQMLQDVYNKYSSVTLGQLPSSGRCNKNNIAVRKEW